jgi:hypothetical protein
MAKNGRAPGFKMPESHRSKIKYTQILNALQEHCLGQRDMSATQVTVGLGLLKKVLPDLSSAEIKSETTVRYVARIPEKARTSEEWQQQHEQPTLQ